MKGTWASAAAAFQAGGAANNGLASSRNRIAVEDAAPSTSRSERDGGAIGVVVGVKMMPPGASMLPTSALRALTASA